MAKLAISRKRRPALVRVLYAEDRFLDLLPLPVCPGVIRLALKLVDHLPQFPPLGFGNPLDQGIGRFKHRDHLLALQVLQCLIEPLASLGPNSLHDGIDRYRQGAVFLKVAHLKGLVTEAASHAANFGGTERDVVRRQFFEELHESQHVDLRRAAGRPSSLQYSRCPVRARHLAD